MSRTLSFRSLANVRPSVAILRRGGAYLVCVYQGGRCVRRIAADDHTAAWELARDLRGAL